MKKAVLVLAALIASATLSAPTAEARGFDLARPNAVTLWWVIFNAPEQCHGSPDPAANCTSLDVFGPAFLESMQNGAPDPSLIVPNLAAKPAMIYATGGTTDWLGRIRLTASIFLSPADAPLALPAGVDPMGFGRAYENPAAEIHLIARDHGRAIWSDLEPQITNLLDPYCSDPNLLYFAGPNTCADKHFAVFGPGESGTDKVYAFTDPTRPLRGDLATLRRDGDVVRAIFETRLRRR